MDYGPKQTTAGLDSLNALLWAYKELGNSTALNDAFFGDNSIYGWGKGIEKNIKADKTRQAKEYLKKMRESDITKSIANDRDILDSFAAQNPYFFDRYDADIQAEKDARLTAESTSALNKVKEEARRRASDMNLRGGDETDIASSLGYTNRTDAEQQAYKQAVIDAWKDRNIPLISQESVKDDMYNDPNARYKYVQGILNRDNINLNATDIVDETKLKPYKENEANRRLLAMIQQGDLSDMNKLREAQKEIDTYASNADIALAERAAQFRDFNKNNLFNQEYAELSQALSELTPEELQVVYGIEDKADQAELMDKYFIPTMAENLGISPQEVYQWATGVNKGMNEFNASSHRLAAKRMSVEQQESNFNERVKEIDDANYGLGTALIKDTNVTAPDDTFNEFRKSSTGSAYINAGISIIGNPQLKEKLTRLKSNRNSDVLLNIVHTLKNKYSGYSYEDIYKELRSNTNNIITADANDIATELLTVNDNKAKIARAKSDLASQEARANANTGNPMGWYRR